MTALALRSIGSNDYAVIEDGYPVGRIRLAAERHGEVWMLPIPGVPWGTVGSLEDAKTTFRQSWMKCKAEIGPERLAPGLETAEAARERGSRTKHHRN